MPITAPPTSATSTSLETAPPSASIPTNTPIENQREKPNIFEHKKVVSAPVFYEDHAKPKISVNNPINGFHNVSLDKANVGDLMRRNNKSGENTALRRCFSTTARGLMWQETHYGEKRHQQCPNNPTSFAEWHCIEKNGHVFWANNWPDFSKCHSTWMEILMKETSLKRIQRGHQITALTDQVFNHLQKRPHELFGGDFFVILRVIQANIKNMKISIDNKLKQRSEFYINEGNLETVFESSIRKSSSILSKVLNVRSIYAWRDLLGNRNMHKATVAKFMDVSENLGAVISLMMTGSEKGYFWDTKRENRYTAKKLIKEGQPGSFEDKENMFAISTSKIEDTVTTKISTSNLCKYGSFIIRFLPCEPIDLSPFVCMCVVLHCGFYVCYYTARSQHNI